MGNCCRRESRSMQVWAGDDWGSLTSKIDEEADHNQNTYNVERLRLLGENGAFALSNSSSTTTGAATREVRVKITKKELEELVGRVDVRGLSAKQVLDRLMDAADHRYDEAEHDHRSWRPALQSIPEVN